MGEDQRQDEGGAALCARAAEAARSAYAPYSKFRVGAAVRGRNGVYVGTNVENASFGLTICAERVALAAAVAAKDLDIAAIAVACIDADPDRGIHEFLPCGACRQWMSELAPDAMVHVAGRPETFRVEDLLPDPFRLGS